MARIPCTVVLIICGVLGVPAAAYADEDFCLRIPVSKLHFRYSPAGDQVSLTVSVPARYLDADFHYAEIQVGDDPENESFLRFTADMTRVDARFSTQVVFPRKHPLVNFRAIYFGKKCLGELIAEFQDSGRVHKVPRER